MSNPDVTPQDALEIAQRAMQKANEVDALRDRIDELESDVIALRMRLSERDDESEYHELTLDDKVGMVRQHGFKKARSRNGKATLDYNDVMWSVFDGEPGTKHCYKLIRRAAGLDEQETGSEYPGFTARDPEGSNYHLAVDASRVKDAASLFPENKTEPAGAD